ncbi:hypothetical protein AB0F36_08030 [Streptomyces sp. NPDC029080]|uniref:hypothetical protein n=1 Tax=Streptomyces sp. NPDC029080 TaxID=3155017 RepID=UPI0033E57F55
MVANVTQSRKTSAEAPADTELIADAVNTVLAMELSTSTRQQIDHWTTRVIGHISLLLAEDLGAEEDDEVMALFRASYYLLDLSRRPRESTPAYEAFDYLRELTTRTRGLLAVYVRRNEIGER